jgi:hypothetical protein
MSRLHSLVVPASLGDPSGSTLFLIEPSQSEPRGSARASLNRTAGDPSRWNPQSLRRAQCGSYRITRAQRDCKRIVPVSQQQSRRGLLEKLRFHAIVCRIEAMGEKSIYVCPIDDLFAGMPDCAPSPHRSPVAATQTGSPNILIRQSSNPIQTGRTRSSPTLVGSSFILLRFISEHVCFSPSACAVAS